MHFFHKEKIFSPKKRIFIALYIHSLSNTVKIKTKIQIKTKTAHLNWICLFSLTNNGKITSLSNFVEKMHVTSRSKTNSRKGRILSWR